MEETSRFAEVWEQSFDSCLPATVAREELPQISVRITRKGSKRPTALPNARRDSAGQGGVLEKGRVRGALQRKEGVGSGEKAWKYALEGKQGKEVLVRSKRPYIKRPQALSSLRSPRERELCLATIHSRRLTPDTTPKALSFSPETRPFRRNPHLLRRV